MQRLWLIAGTILGVVAGWASSNAAQVRGTIFGPGARSYPIAIAPLKQLSPRAPSDVATRFTDIVARDLTLSGYFKVLDRAAYIEKPKTSGYLLDTINFDRWSVIGALALVKGAYTTEGDNLSVEVRLFDVYQRRQLTGRRYHGSVSEMRRMASKFADEIMAQFTGARGPFDSRLAFVSTRDGRFKQIYVMSPDGGDLQQVTRTETINVSPTWSPDGHSLLFTSYERRNPDLYAIALLSGRETLLSRRPGLNLAGELSPSGKQIAVTVEDSGNANIALLDRSGKMIRHLTDSWSIDVSPTWSPGGRYIAFCSNRAGTPQIYVMNADGSDARRLTFTGSYNTSPAWSPKGDRIAYVSRMDGAFNLFTVKTDGTDVRQLTQGAGNNEDPSWAPDGRYIVFSSSRSGRKKLFVTDSTGSSQVQLTRGRGDDTSPAWSRWLD
ncbi:MAG: Tol-Pal system beta propeller repeat protein TolB [Candidatus Binatia bacterium]